MTAEAQSVHEAEGHGVDTPAETALGSVELWKNVGGKASVNEVLKKFQSKTREMGQGWTSKRRIHKEPQHKVEKGKQKMTPPRERDFEERVWQATHAWCRLVAHGKCTNEFVVREGPIKSARFVQGRERETERKKTWKNGRAKGNVLRQEGGQNKKDHATAYGKGQE